MKMRNNSFTEAARFLVQQSLDEKGLPDNILLAHGFVHGQGKAEGLVFAHAWIEVEGIIVIDRSNDKNIRCLLPEYYAEGVIEETVVRYTPQEAFKIGNKAKTAGPWHESFSCTEYRLQEWEGRA